MKQRATSPLEEKKTERLEAVSAQYWQDDLTQLEALERQWRRDQVPYLRRTALHIGVLVLSASGASSLTNGRYGRYTAWELAAELGPTLASAAQFLERHGYSIIPVPAPLLTLAEQLAGQAPGSRQMAAGLLELLQVREASGELSDEFTAQYWRDDLSQLKALDVQRNRDLASFMRRAAVHIGVLVLTASGAPNTVRGTYGRYAAGELTAELGPTLASAIHFLEQQGYSALPVPTVVTTLLVLLAKIIEQGKALFPGVSGVPGRETGENREASSGIDGTAPKHDGEAQRAIPGQETRQRMRYTEEGNI